MMLNELGIEVDHLRFLTYEYIASMFPRAEDFPEFVLFRHKVSVFKGELNSVTPEWEECSDNEDPKKLFEDWKLSAVTLTRLKTFGLTTKTLKLLCSKDLDILFPGLLNLAEKAKFAAHLKKWRGEIEDCVITCMPPNAPNPRMIDSDSLRDLENLTEDQMCIPNNLLLQHRWRTDSRNSLTSILNFSRKGREISTDYKENKRLTSKQQKMLVHVISDFLMETEGSRLPH